MRTLPSLNTSPDEVRCDIDDDFGAALQVDRFRVAQAADTDLGSLQVGQDSDRAVLLLGNRAHPVNGLLDRRCGRRGAQLMRKTSTPASTNRLTIVSLLEAGPRVATILVRFCHAIQFCSEIPPVAARLGERTRL
jgi:hypothetical protein